ncbi:DUF2490 domain-containing protein [Sphingomonas sp.]|uniref:DUF2490 domain-containing protein n=1 Tax=Sphingomonas sp. TaxID=28214 RepID=UPI001B03FB0C|nr:DUF2490 domain-containing protein [Sphingomonas sp.]MBO9713208.1 DUF2490 domain-containing protein [Sphingomonas sp.]
MLREPAIAALLLVATPAAAQDVDTQFWLSGSLQADVVSHLPVSLDTTARFGDAADGLYEWARGGFAGYRTDGDVELLGGYQRVTGYRGGQVTRLEQRIRQQVTVPVAKLFGGTLTSRTRIEERFRRGTGGMGLRIREQVRFTLPLRKGGPSFMAWHESFLEANDTRWGSNAGLRRMRNYLGFELPLTRELRAQAGYLNQYDFGVGGKRDAMANVLLLSIGAKF